MKRTLLSAGLVLTLLPSVAHADALSPWVQKVMDRIDTGIATANSLEADANACDPAGSDAYIAEAEKSIRAVIDVRNQISRQRAANRDNTVCFQNDLGLLEDKLNEIRNAIHQAVGACRNSGARTLGRVMEFGADAYELLARHGVDPSVKSNLLLVKYAWEDADLLRTGTGDALNTDHADEPQCPYTTDYSPHFIGYIPSDSGDASMLVSPDAEEVKSYGCDSSVISNLAIQNSETADMQTFVDTTNEFATNLSDTVAEFLNNINFTIAALRGDTDPLPTIPPPGDPPDHEVQAGCLRPSVALTSLTGEGVPDSMLDDYPDYFSEGNMREVEIAPGVNFVTFNPPTDEALPVGAFLRPAYDYFSIYSNPVSMHRRFIEKKTNLGYSRPLPVVLQDSMFNLRKSLTLWTYGMDSETQYREISASIDEQTGFLEENNRDAIERTLQAYAPLQTAVADLAKVTEEELPDYVADFGYFMLRQCVNGHCSATDGTLDTMIKRIYNPACHPYVSGAYTDHRTYAKCLCIEKSDEHPEGLDRSNEEDDKYFKKYCLPDPTEEDQEKWDEMEPELFPGCRNENDPDAGY